MNYTYDIYTPQDKDNTSGATSEKKALDYAEFEDHFVNMEWDTYPASPTITVYNDKLGSNLWVSLYATSEDEQKLRMFIIGHKYLKESKGLFGLGKPKLKDTMTTHFTVGKENVLKLFKSFFTNNSGDILYQLALSDAEFKKNTSQ
jgi:hypothetical protein